MSSSSVSVPTINSLERYLLDITRYPIIDRQEEARLAKKIRRGCNDALGKLVCSNLRFVVTVSKRYQNLGVPLEDLINEGNLGLMRAAKKFDEKRGTKFITYAVWWIRQAILEAIAEQSCIIRLPMNRAAILQRFSRHVTRLYQKLGREPTLEEIAEDMAVSKPVLEVTLAVAPPHFSLDSPTALGADTTLFDFTPDPLVPPPDDGTFERSVAESLRKTLATLSEREARVLRLYYGLEDGEPMTLGEIGEISGVTRERVRQIKQRALRRLRHPSRARLLDSLGD